MERHADWSTDGSIASSLGGNQNAFLPFTPVSGFLYTLSLDMDMPQQSGDAWGVMGFSSGNNTGAAPWDNDNLGLYGWMLQRADRGVSGTSYDQAFTGKGFNNNGENTTIGPDGSSNYKVVLDTTGSNWSFTFYTGGSATPNCTRTFPGVITDINYIAIGSMNSGHRVDNLSLIVSDAVTTEYTWSGAVSSDPTFSGSGSANWTSGGTPTALVSGTTLHAIFGRKALTGPR